MVCLIVGMLRFGLAGKLTIQPEYQRNYIYAEKGGRLEIAVIKSLLGRDEIECGCSIEAGGTSKNKKGGCCC